LFGDPRRLWDRLLQNSFLEAEMRRDRAGSFGPLFVTGFISPIRNIQL
jgi:hypothetical protein